MIFYGCIICSSKIIMQLKDLTDIEQDFRQIQL